MYACWKPLSNILSSDLEGTEDSMKIQMLELFYYALPFERIS